jgi:hypothetical protein
MTELKGVFFSKFVSTRNKWKNIYLPKTEKLLSIINLKDEYIPIQGKTNHNPFEIPTNPKFSIKLTLLYLLLKI